MEEIVLQIKNELKKRKITYKEFSKICNISTGTLMQIFSNRGINPRIDTINAMLSALELNQYEKSPTGTFLTNLEKKILDATISCTEHEQELIIAYITGLKDKSTVQKGTFKLRYDDKTEENTADLGHNKDFG